MGLLRLSIGYISIFIILSCCLLIAKFVAVGILWSFISIIFIAMSLIPIGLIINYMFEEKHNTGK